MNTSLQARPRGLGVAGVLIGLLSLIAVAISQWALPPVLPGGTAHHAAVDTGHSLEERIMAKLKRVTPKKEETRSALWDWRHLFFNAAVSFGVLSIMLAVLSLIRREEKLYAGVAVALGVGAIALQTAILFASLGAARGDPASVFGSESIRWRISIRGHGHRCDIRVRRYSYFRTGIGFASTRGPYCRRGHLDIDCAVVSWRVLEDGKRSAAALSAKYMRQFCIAAYRLERKARP